jgi:hypothetical protein
MEPPRTPRPKWKVERTKDKAKGKEEMAKYEQGRQDRLRTTEL